MGADSDQEHNRAPVWEERFNAAVRRSQATIDTTVTDIERQTAADMARVWETARVQVKEVLAGEIGRAYVEAEKVRESDLKRAHAEISRLGAQIEDDLLQSKRMIAQVRAEAESRERNWEADATRKLEAAVREARSEAETEAETEATFIFAAEQVRWEKDLKETVATGSSKRPRCYAPRSVRRRRQGMKGSPIANGNRTPPPLVRKNRPSEKPWPRPRPRPPPPLPPSERAGRVPRNRRAPQRRRRPRR